MKRLWNKSWRFQRVWNKSCRLYCAWLAWCQLSSEPPWWCVLFICGSNTTHKTQTFFLLLNRAGTETCFSLQFQAPRRPVGWVGGHSQDSWPKLPKGIFHTIWYFAQQLKLLEWRSKRACSWLRCLSSQATVRHAEPLLLRKRLHITSGWEAVN